MTADTKVVVGLFDTVEEARDVVQELIDSGFSRDNISLITHDKEAGDDQSRSVGARNEVAEGAKFGTQSGAIMGGMAGLLVGLSALAIPGIGPLVAAGPIVTALGSTALGAGIGATAGSIIGALVGLGVPEDHAHSYAEGVRRGGSLVTVEASDMMVNRAYDIMTQHGAVDINDRSNQWRQSGWTAFDPNVGPYDPNAPSYQR